MLSHDEPMVEVVLDGDDVCHARVSGEIDFDSATMVRARLQALVTRQCGKLSLDVSGVTFCDSSGLGVLVGLRSAAREHGGWLVLTGAQGQLERLLQITGLDRLFLDDQCRRPAGGGVPIDGATPAAGEARAAGGQAASGA